MCNNNYPRILYVPLYTNHGVTMFNRSGQADNFNLQCRTVKSTTMTYEVLHCKPYVHPCLNPILESVGLILYGVPCCFHTPLTNPCFNLRLLWYLYIQALLELEQRIWLKQR